MSNERSPRPSRSMTMGTSGMLRSFVQLLGCVLSESVSCNPMVARDITIDGDPDEVWEALNDPELLAEWLGEDGQALVEEAEPAERLVLWLLQGDEAGARVGVRRVAPAGRAPRAVGAGAGRALSAPGGRSPRPAASPP